MHQSKWKSRNNNAGSSFMNASMEQGRRSYKPSFLMLAILSVHVVGIGSIMIMQGCTTKQQPVEPPPAPLLPPRTEQAAPPAPMPRPTFKPPVAVDRAPSSIDAASASTYTVQKGDSLSKIAARAGVSVSELSEINKITDKNSIRIGQKLLLPSHAKALPSAPAPSAPSVPKAAKAPAGPAVASGDVHTVQTGDTLGKLAVRYGTTSAAFKSVNNLKSDMIRIGQKLSIPKSKEASSASAPAVETAAPAAATDAAPAAEPVTAPALVEPAPAVEPAAVDASAAAPAATESVDAAASDADAPFPYNVKDGDTLDSIAIKFSARKDVIMRLNNMTSETVRPGQKLLIPWQ
jgi:LysM repeat protein